jgi:hypothetical protein
MSDYTKTYLLFYSISKFEFTLFELFPLPSDIANYFMQLLIRLSKKLYALLAT